MPRTWSELLLVVGVAVLAVGLLGGFGGGPNRTALSPDRASWTVTPGATNPDVTQDSIGETICRQGWTKTVRPPTEYTNELKVEGMKTYGRLGEPSDYQEDHLISLELGGHPTDPRNLWPQPIERAVEVDDVENQLNEQVCSAELTLTEAQRRESELKHTAG
jgi:hypothetical protein